VIADQRSRRCKIKDLQRSNKPTGHDLTRQGAQGKALPGEIESRGAKKQ
jgi:hypothetical protein